MRSLFAAAFALVFSSTAFASSHREAPFITKNPKVDNTDFYIFNSYETGRTAFTTIISNFQPLQAAYGGPNYFTMDPEALYEIHIDNTGEGVEDITFQFRFSNDLLNGVGIAVPIAQADGGGGFPTADGGVSLIPIPLINAAALGVNDGGTAFTKPGPFQGLQERFTAGIVRGPRRGAAAQAITNTVGGGAVFDKPLDNIGSKTFPGNTYANYAATFIYTVTIPGCAVPAKMFVGSRKEGFAVNLGPIFDLVNAPASVITDPALRAAGGANPIGSANVTTIALEIDKTCLQPNLATQPVIGAWSSASLRQARVLNPAAPYVGTSREGGAWVQVSRLGSPLVNEVVIGLPDKDKFNASEPKDDAANFAKYVFNPTLPFLIEVLFGVSSPKVFPRTDLVAAFLTGVGGVNKFPGMQPPTEMLRLNLMIPATVPAMQNNLGALACFDRLQSAPAALDTTNAGCDPAGFPNGRRPGDDTVDVALRVVMGVLLSIDDSPVGGVPFHDAILQDQSQFDTTFPYLKNPNPGS